MALGAGGKQFDGHADLLFDEISCGLKIKEMQTKKRDLLESLEMYYKIFALGETFEEAEES